VFHSFHLPFFDSEKVKKRRGAGTGGDGLLAIESRGDDKMIATSYDAN